MGGSETPSELDLDEERRKSQFYNEPIVSMFIIIHMPCLTDYEVFMLYIVNLEHCEPGDENVELGEMLLDLKENMKKIFCNVIIELRDFSPLS
ncbi:Hypothetical predicted protein [Octopus vulgaris]|uniref:Uncharacterized protein n=1 Tax=Octopus vulgaris TaxID=6645 RepID=A0AA36EWM5_OCTVU|nr:Hypothetical predicted protein [Octopus vulgaris]